MRFPLFIALVMVSAANADTLVRDVMGYAPTPDGVASFDYLVFDDAGRVVRAGRGEPPPADEIIEGQGRIMLPGLIDAHGHVSRLGLARLDVDLVATRSLDEALERIVAHAASHVELPWIVGRGWNQELWPARQFPTAADIDARVADRPVWLNRIDGHAGWANSKALAMAGIVDATPDPEGGEILRDPSGRATGVLIDRAMELVDAVVPRPSVATLDRAFDLAFAELAANGITAVHDAGISLTEARLYQARTAARLMPVRVYGMLAGPDVVKAFGAPFASDDERFVVRSMKLVADGALGSRGAALIEPYADERDNRGLVIEDVPMLTANIRAARSLGYQVNVHAIGDRANRNVLTAFEAAGATAAERHRIEHAQVVDLADFPRFAALGVTASMQPIHATSDRTMAIVRLDPHRLAGAYAWRRFLDLRVRLPAGSDFPVEPVNPFLGWHAAVTRENLEGEPAGGWLPDQKMTPAEAFRAFTVDAAYAAFQESSMGTLAPGSWADFILVDADPFTVPPRRIADIHVVQTWVGGTRVH